MGKSEDETLTGLDWLFLFLGVSLLILAAFGTYYLLFVSPDYTTLKAKCGELAADNSALRIQYYRCRDDQQLLLARVEMLKNETTDLENKLDVAARYHILYDEVVSYINWYHDVNTCDEFLMHYTNARDSVKRLRSFILSHEDDLEEIFSDEIAAEYGYDHGFRSSDVLPYLDQFLGVLHSTYQYCTGE